MSPDDVNDDDGTQDAGSVFAVVTGGGTAGHVYPALAVAEALVDAGRPVSSVAYLGARRGLETRLVPPTGFPFVALDVVGVQRGRSASALKANLAVAPKLARGYRQARRLLAEWRPRLVVSVGGYASLPASLAARRLGIPVVVVSWDQRPGWASTLTARWAAACAVAFEDSPLPNATVVGFPVRRMILDVDRDGHRQQARQALGIDPDRFLVAVMGGSQGSGVLNTAIADYVTAHADDRDLAVYHLAGDRFVDRAPPRRDDDPDGVWYRPVGFDERIDRVYAACDLLVGRGGAGTVGDVAVTGTPAVLVPWAAAAEDHQRANVAWLARGDAAVALDETAVGDLGRVIDELRADPARRAELAANAHRLGEPTRAGAMAGLLERVALA